MTHAPSRERRITACDKILARLKNGPATSLELSELGGLNYRARVSDLRKRIAKLGDRIECKAHPTQEKVNVYRLVEYDLPQNWEPDYGPASLDHELNYKLFKRPRQ